ncbi:Hypothetical predicted protein [Marmota monax]|uniref:Uncharacterized protein n=1 Tax=Marmota monax TaxID=9995 RepID=A0A5E4C6Z8_MARMO|nr:Hypothetical predicted protein [Marmota monax]
MPGPRGSLSCTLSLQVNLEPWCACCTQCTPCFPQHGCLGPLGGAGWIQNQATLHTWEAWVSGRGLCPVQSPRLVSVGRGEHQASASRLETLPRTRCLLCPSLDSPSPVGMATAYLPCPPTRAPWLLVPHVRTSGPSGACGGRELRC